MCREGYNLFMRGRATLLEALGGEAGCKRLSAKFYARVGKDPVLRPLFPGKSLRCAIEEFGAFLIQFLGGDEEQTQYRWWLSLRESHARFQIGPAERSAWLKHMGATLEGARLDEGTRKAFGQFFLHSSAYVVGKEAADPEHEELAARWAEQRVLDDAIGAIAVGHDHEALALAAQFATHPSVFVGLLARMVQSGRGELVRFAIDAVEKVNPPSRRAVAPDEHFCISHPAQDASRWSRCCCNSARTQTFRTAAAIRRSTAWPTNAGLK
jgi:hemoglobin